MKNPLAIICLLAAMVCQGCTWMFFSPGRDFLTAPEVMALMPKDVYFRSPDGLRLHGWHFRHRGGIRRGVVLVCHGNKENLSTHVKLDLWLVSEGYDLFIFDYRGYGRSEGKTTVEGIHMDATAALTTLLDMPGNSKERVIVLGKSLGGAVCVHTVAASPHKDRIRTLVIEGAFADYRIMARQEIEKTPTGWVVKYPLSLLVNNHYSPLEWIPKVPPVPTLIMHGYEDPIVPVLHGRLLYGAALEPKKYWELEGLGHTESSFSADTRKRLLRYLGSVDEVR